MKKGLLNILFLTLSLSCFAQMQDKFWVLFGAEIVHGSYTGISPQVADDQYKLYNVATSRMEMMGNKGNSFVDFSFNSIWLFNMNENFRSTSLTEKGFHKVQNIPMFRFCYFKLKGDENSKRMRFGLGWQFDWRKMGLMNNSDNNSFSAFGSPGLSYGPLEFKGRAALGGNLHLAKQSKFLYTRLSLNADFSPGKIKGYSIYPEGTFIASFKRISIFGIATYRTDFLSGNRQTIDRFTNVPQKTNTISTEWRFQLGMGIDIWKFGKK